MLTFFSFRLVETNSPALLKRLSEGTDVATVERNTIATLEIMGKMTELIIIIKLILL